MPTDPLVAAARVLVIRSPRAARTLTQYNNNGLRGYGRFKVSASGNYPDIAQFAGMEVTMRPGT